MKVIEVKDLVKTFKVKVKEKGLKGSLKAIVKPKYQEIKAVKDISFDVEEGEIIAFIGPNGAGKSTTIKMLTGILYPSSGEMKVIDIDPCKQRKKLAYKIGTVFGQKEQLWKQARLQAEGIRTLTAEEVEGKREEMVKLDALHMEVKKAIQDHFHFKTLTTLSRDYVSFRSDAFSLPRFSITDM